MNLDPEASSDSRIEEILDLLAQLALGILDARAEPSGSGDTIDQVIQGLNAVADDLASVRLSLARADQRSAELVDSIIALANLDYTQQASISGEGDVFDAIAVGLNALGEELHSSTVSKAYFENITTSMHDTLIVLDPQNKIRLVNHAAQSLLGYSDEDLIGQPLQKVLAAGSYEEIGLDEVIETGIGKSVETKYRTKNGRFIPVLFSASLMRDERDRLQAVVCVAQDITERVQAETALLRSNRAYRTLSDCNQAMVRATDEMELINEVCRIVVEVGGYRLAWVGFAEQDEAKSVRPVAQAGYEEGYLESVQISWADNARGRGPTGTAIRTGQPYVAHDILTNPDFTPWRAEALKRGYAASIALPLLVDEKVLGALNIYAAAPNAFDSHEVDLLMELAGDLAYGIANLRTRAEKKRVERSLRDALEETAHSQRLLLALSQAAQQVQRAHTPDDVYRTIGDEVVGLGYQAAILTISDDRNYLVLAHFASAPDLISTAEKLTGLSARQYRFPLLRGHAFTRIIDERVPVFMDAGDAYIADALPKLIRPLAGKLADLFGVRKNIGAPLVVGGEFHGILFVFGASLREADVPAVSTFANAAAIALENAELGQENRQQAERLQEILNTIPEGIILLDAAYRVRLANPAGQLHLRTLANIEVGGVLTRLGDRDIANILESIAVGRLWHEIRLPEVRKTYNLTAQPLKLGSQAGDWVLIVRDITEERARLEYQQAQERLATVGQLAAGVAHDFNNIVAVISLYSELMMKSRDLSLKNRGRVATIHEQAHRAADLTGQILDFSRRSVIERSPIELLSFLEEVLILLKRTMPESISLELDSEPGDYFVYADPTRLQQAIMNLSVNARDAMPVGGELRMILAHLQLKQDAKSPLPDMRAGRWIKLVVSDTGGGVESRYHPHVFEPFFTTKPPGKGTGLGLAQVYGIVKQHGGHISFSSRVGQGTTITIYLPAIELDAVDMGLVEAVLESSIPQGNGEIILVVEDNEATRAAMCDMLRALGYRYLEAANGEEALQVYQEHEDITLVLSDLVMPKMGGEALFRALNERDPGVKMVAVTGYPLAEEGKTLLEMGMVSWVMKPLSKKQLAQTIAEALDLPS